MHDTLTCWQVLATLHWFSKHLYAFGFTDNRYDTYVLQIFFHYEKEVYISWDWEIHQSFHLLGPCFYRQHPVLLIQMCLILCSIHLSAEHSLYVHGAVFEQQFLHSKDCKQCRQQIVDNRNCRNCVLCVFLDFLLIYL